MFFFLLSTNRSPSEQNHTVSNMYRDHHPKNAKKPNNYENRMYNRYMERSRLVGSKIPPEDLCNGSEWDQVSKRMWEKFAKRQQSAETYKKKVSLWDIMYKHIKVTSAFLFYFSDLLQLN